MRRMEKGYLATGVFLTSALLLGLWLLTSPRPVCSMHRACPQPETNIANVSFSGEAGGRIKCAISTHAESGTVDFFLYDGNGAIVKEFDRADALTICLPLAQSQTYTLEAAYKDFTGTFSAAIYKVD